MHACSSSVPLSPENDFSSMTRIINHDDSDYNAQAIFRRYKSQFIGDQIVRAIINLKENRNKQTISHEFEQKRQEWTNQGGYIETISLENISRWIKSKHYLIAEAAQLTATENQFIPIADCIFHFPKDSWIVPCLDDSIDEIFIPNTYQSIQKAGYQASAIIDFLSVLKSYSGSHFAGLARYAGIQEVLKLNAESHSSNPIRYIFGLTFAIQGIKIYDQKRQSQLGQRIMLADLNQNEIINQASMRAISKSRRCPAQLVGKWKNAPIVPIHVDGNAYGLLVHWYCHVRTLDTFKQ